MAGRPPRDFDASIFEGLCHVQCTNSEIESIFHTDLRTVDKWCKRHYDLPFDAAYKRFAEGGKASLRRFQFHLAEKNAAMAIWLGKIWLGQKDPVDELGTKRALGILEQIRQVHIVDGNPEAKVPRSNTYPIEEASGEPICA